MTAFISAVALLLGALGLVLIGVFLNRMVDPMKRLIATYSENRAAKAVPTLVKNLLDAWPADGAADTAQPEPTVLPATASARRDNSASS